jgi:catechol-2,3-dioxygenase
MGVETDGIRHLHLLVGDHERSVSFYEHVFGMSIIHRAGPILFLSSPSGRDNLALHAAENDQERARVGQQGGYDHFGITVEDRSALEEAITLALQAGGSLVGKGEHAPGVPYVYLADPDGYVIEI